jgi:hydroxymethylpyrimidine pyrophosphatase-like HAD family hydrolase
MRYLVLATDYDSTLAHDGRVRDATLAALNRLRQSGRHLVLVTGRELDDLLAIFPQVDLFARVVAENGALLYRPAVKEQKVLAPAPPPALVQALQKRGVKPLSVGRSIVATCEPHHVAVLETIRRLGLEWHVVFNKGSVMVLPSGVNKATGLAAALEEMGLSAHNTVGVGDAENDQAFLARCECAVAVANALPALKQTADLVTRGREGAGVVEVIDRLLKDDLAELTARLGRHTLLLGKRVGDDAEQRLEPYGINVLVAGTSGSGKSTLTTGLLERLAEGDYQFVILDPEGDYSTLEGAVVLGGPQRAPLGEEVLDLLKAPGHNVVVNLLGLALEHRPPFFDSLLPRLQELRTRTGRPHWIIVDEAHHLLPTTWAPAGASLPPDSQGMLAITVHPESVAPAVLKSIHLVLAVGQSPERTLEAFATAAGLPAPHLAPVTLATGEVLAWQPHGGGPPCRVRTQPPRTERIRHSRKYAEGDLGPDRSFYFRGPEGKLNLRAQNLLFFLRLAEGVDDDTWTHHLRRGEYSAWFRDKVKDDDLAAEVAGVEATAGRTSARDSRAAVRAAIERRYTLPAEKPSGVQDPGK